MESIVLHPLVPAFRVIREGLLLGLDLTLDHPLSARALDKTREQRITPEVVFSRIAVQLIEPSDG